MYIHGTYYQVHSSNFTIKNNYSTKLLFYPENDDHDDGYCCYTVFYMKSYTRCLEYVQEDQGRNREMRDEKSEAL